MKKTNSTCMSNNIKILEKLKEYSDIENFKVYEISVENFNYSLFYSYKFDVNQKVQIMTGPNGFGKTTLLKLIGFSYSFLSTLNGTSSNFNLTKNPYPLYGFVTKAGDLSSIIGDIYFDYIKIRLVAHNSYFVNLIYKKENSKDFDYSLTISFNGINKEDDCEFVYHLKGSRCILENIETATNKHMIFVIASIFKKFKYNYLKSSRISDTRLYKYFMQNIYPEFIQSFADDNVYGYIFQNNIQNRLLPGGNESADFYKLFKTFSNKLSKAIETIIKDYNVNDFDPSISKTGSKIISFFNNICFTSPDDQDLNDVDILTMKLFNFYKKKNISSINIDDELLKVDSSLIDLPIKYEKLCNHFNSKYKDSSKIRLSYNLGETTFEFIYPNRDKKISINKLSSGELNDLLMFYTLIFKDNTLLMMDEPEISLHIEWQMTLLNEILELAENKNQIIIATHSPFIIGDDDENMKYVAISKYDN